MTENDLRLHRAANAIFADPLRAPASGLFVVGHARSGTTVMQRALNTSPDVFLFGEANIHAHRHKEDFAAWYNAMHISFANPPAKGDRCPDVDGDAFDVLAELGRHYAWVGEKIGFRDDSLGYSFDQSLRFHMRWFPKASYICTLRNPRCTLLSNIWLFAPEDMSVYALSYAKSLLHLTNIYLTFDRALVAHYETLTPASFERIAGYLDTDLHEAFSEYDTGRQAPRPDGPLAIADDDFRVLTDGYERLAAMIDPVTMRIQNRSALRDLQREFDRLVQWFSARALAMEEQNRPAASATVEAS